MGDAIESALSETGGTKDLGLYRTPTHIRQMMVKMVDPNFNDSIFDPACGTAGFLFDAYEYVIEKAKLLRKIPSENVANQFYRTGIGGIEYSGRIRKMAAVNMYIRGLNPHNIQQGDSLKIYDPAKDHESKSIVIANPPFGAETDQPAYPNVWEEYSKETETTILFVKLMFDLLKQNGRCAVIVSEGFLTWGQNSACALRKILLNDANLRAVISLPQGVFVSKSGQGAKTSILYFEKGKPTNFVWYYKIENDGFSMGTNRKEISNSQIPELLEIFKEIKKGNKPKDSKHSFCISKEQIETLDPRIVKRIKKEVGEKIKEKNDKRREKLEVELYKKLVEKKINKKMFDEKKWQFDNVVQSQIENEVAKAIEKAHTYHFNLQNYRSNLSDAQIKDWQETLKGIEIKNNSKIEKRYQELQKAEPKNTLQILASFDPHNNLHMDIAREYLSKLDKKILDKNKKLFKLEEILRKGFQYPLVELHSLIKPKFEKIKKDDFKGEFDVVEKISFGIGKVYIRDKRETGMDLYKAETGDLITSKINVHQGAVALSPSDLVCSTHYQIYSIDRTEVNSKYLLLMLRSKKFLENINITKAGGIKNEAGSEFLGKFKIPLPLLETQNEIEEKIEKQKMIIEGAEKIGVVRNIDYDLFENFEKKNIDYFCELNPSKEINLTNKELVSFVPMNAVDDVTGVIIKLQERELIEVNKGYTHFKTGDVIFAKITPCMENGKIAIAENLKNDIGFGSTEFHVFRAKIEKSLPKYIYYVLRTKKFRQLAKEKMTGSSGHKRVPETFLKEYNWPLPPLDIQRQIVKKLDKQMQALEGVRLLKNEAEKRIEEILARVWGEENNYVK